MITTGASPEAAILMSDFKNNPSEFLGRAAGAMATGGLSPISSADVKAAAQAGRYYTIRGIMNAQNKENQ